MGMDSYIIFFALVGISMALLGLNMMATIITMRAPGLTWSRLPIFVWSVFATVDPDGAGGADADRHAADGGARPHDQHLVLRRRRRRQLLPVPEPVLVLRAPRGVRARAARASGSCSSCCPCSRASRCGATGWPSSGMLGVTLLSFFVWQHHLFVSGINADLRPFYMLSTEIISIPTGLHLPVRDGDAVEGANRRSRVPMLFCLAWTFNFLIGGALGRVPVGHPERHRHPRQLLRDGPLPLHDHGRARSSPSSPRSTTGCRR